MHTGCVLNNTSRLLFNCLQAAFKLVAGCTLIASRHFFLLLGSDIMAPDLLGKSVIGHLWSDFTCLFGICICSINLCFSRLYGYTAFLVISVSSFFFVSFSIMMIFYLITVFHSKVDGVKISIH